MSKVLTKSGIIYSLCIFLSIIVFSSSSYALEKSQWDYDPLDVAGANYSINVNNTNYHQGLTPQQVADLKVETDPLSWHANNATENRNFTTSGNVTASYGFFTYIGDLVSRVTKGWFTDIDFTGTTQANQGNITNVTNVQFANITGACLDYSGLTKNSTHYCFT